MAKVGKDVAAAAKRSRKVGKNVKRSLAGKMKVGRKAQKRAKAGTSQSATAARKAKFVEAYIANGGNGTEAAKTAGYSERTANEQAARLLADVSLRRAVEARANEVARITGLDTERTLREVARVAYSDPRRFYGENGTLIPVRDLDDDAAACVAQVEVEEIKIEGGVIGHTVKLKQWDKNAALEKAMKFHGLYKADNDQKPDIAPVRIIVVPVAAKS